MKRNTKKIISLLLLNIFAFANLNCTASCAQIKAQTNMQNVISKPTKTEHLVLTSSAKKKTPTDIVVTTPVLATVIEYNVIEVTFAQNFSTKTSKVGDSLSFMLNNGLATREGTQILPPGSQVVAKVSEITKPKSFNRSGKVMLLFDSVILPNGAVMPLDAKVFAKNGKLSRGKLNALGKGMGTTLGMMAIGTGAGCGIGVAAGAVIVGGFAIGMPVGFAVGAIAGLVTPGLHYKANAGDKLLIQLTDDLAVQKL